MLKFIRSLLGTNAKEEAVVIPTEVDYWEPPYIRISEADNAAIDRYFELGEEALLCWREGLHDEAFALAREQVDWYRSRHYILRTALCGDLPKSIRGLDVILRYLCDQGDAEGVAKLAAEFAEITDPESEYGSYLDEAYLDRVRARKLRLLGEAAANRGEIQEAIQYFEEALEKDPRVGVKRQLLKLKKDMS